MREIKKYVALLLIFTSIFLMGFTSPDANNPDRVRITLKYGDYSIVYNDHIIKPTNHMVADEIHKRKINAAYEQKMNCVDVCIYAGSDYKTALLYSFPLLENTINTAIKKINAEPKNSKILFYPNKKNMFSISKEKEGARVEESVLYRNIYFALRREMHVKIDIIATILKPMITAEDNSKITGLRAKFSTYYGASGECRRQNIEVALGKINGTVLNPNDEFSFNKIAGKRSEAGGYKKSIIISRGEYVEGIGGGVCQVSTTVYNCAILADMDITAVRNHSLEPSYVWPSFDAMVSGATDLKFKNAGKMPVFIKAYPEDGNAVVEIYGSKLPYRIVRRSEEISREEPPEDNILIDTQYKYFKKEDYVTSGTQKRVWYSKGQLKSTGYLLYYDHQNRFLEKKHIRTDTYNRTNGLIAVAP